MPIQSSDCAPVLVTVRSEHPESRRDATREKLIGAASDLFQSRDEVSIDEIVKRARLSRATFYLHYASSKAILADIVREGSAGVDSFYRQLAGGPRPTKRQLREFIDFRVRATRKARRKIALHYRAASYNPEIWRTFVINRDRHMQILGETIPAFKSGKKKQSIREKRRRAAAHLMLFQLEQTAHYATFVPELADLEEQIDVLANAFQNFIDEYTD